MAGELDQADILRRKWKTAPGQLWRIPSRSQNGKSHRLALWRFPRLPQAQDRLMDGCSALLLATEAPLRHRLRRP